MRRVLFLVSLAGVAVLSAVAVPSSGAATGATGPVPPAAAPGPTWPARSTTAPAGSISTTDPSVGALDVTVTVHVEARPLRPVTAHPEEVPVTAKSAVVRPVTGSLKISPNEIFEAPVGAVASSVRDRTVGGVESWDAPVVAAIRAATSLRIVGRYA